MTRFFYVRRVDSIYCLVFPLDNDSITKGTGLTLNSAFDKSAFIDTILRICHPNELKFVSM